MAGCLLLFAVLPASGEARGDGVRPVALILHGGGFVVDVSERARAERIAERAGFRPRFVAYPRYDVQGAVRFVRAVARRERARGRRVYAYGESVGGTMAALLAQGGLARAAATYSPIASLTKMVAHSGSPELYQAVISASDRDLRRNSAGRFDSRRPIFALRAVDDSPFINRGIRSWDRRDADVRSIAVEGAHLGEGSPRIYARNARTAITWLARRAGIERRGLDRSGP